MRTVPSTFLSAVLGPLMFAAAACFISTDDGTYDSYDESGGPPCPNGSPGCACTQSGLCDEGLECIEQINICQVQGECDVGAAGCECTPGGFCDGGLVCREEVCVSDEPCLDAQVGSESCQCLAGGGCDVGLTCLSGVCVDASGLTTSSTGEPSPDDTDTDDGTSEDDGTTSGGSGPGRDTEPTTTEPTESTDG